MKKLRYYLAAIALAATLSAPALGIAAGSLANATASRHVSAPSVSTQSTRAVAFFKPWCPIPGADC